MANRIIQSPGIQISETDLSLSPNLANTTTVVIPGFAPQGPINQPLQVASLSEFQQIYGLATNGAERYFYNTVKAVFQSSANVMVARIPYDTSVISNGQIGILAYPTVYVDWSTTSTGVTSLSTQTFNQTASGTYILGQPVHYTLTPTQFQQFQAGNLFTYQPTCSGTLNSGLSSLGYAALIIANQSGSTIDQLFEGQYIVVADNVNLNPINNLDTINQIDSLQSPLSFVATEGFNNGQFLPLPSTRYGFPLSATPTGPDGSLTAALNSIPSFDIYSSPFRTYDDTLIIGLFSLKQSVFSSTNIQLTFNLTEGYMGSLDSTRTINSPNGGPPTSFFLESVVQNSSNISVKVNPYLSRKAGGVSTLGPNGVPQVKVRTANVNMNTSSLLTSSQARQNILGFTNPAIITGIINTLGDNNALMPLGAYVSSDVTINKSIGNVPLKLQTIFNTLLNSDVYNVNVICEGGLGTIYACANVNAAGVFDDYAYVNTNPLTAYDGSTINTTLIGDYQAVLNTFDNFIENGARKDCIGIADPLTPILVQANSLKTLDVHGTTFTQNILWPLKNLYAPYNTSYLCMYPTVVQVSDDATGNLVWVPFSGFAAANFANTDSNFYPWAAPAGTTRGIVKGVSDLAYYPRQTDRDQLYNSSFNPVAYFPDEGFTIYGQKTLLNQPSAFNRINVRRLFLALEIATKKVLKSFVFEPNTLFTQTQIINALTPIFDNAKNTQGVYDYLIICNSTNNTPAVIDDNSLVIDIYIKPVRTAEFILCNFYATTTGTNFQEITS